MPASRRLHIAYAIDTYDGVKTGGVISAHRFVDALRERHDVTVITGGESGEGRVGLPHFAIGAVMKKTGFAFAWPARRRLEAILREVDVLHVQFPFYLGIKAGEIARELDTPVVAASHILPENLLHAVGVHSPWLNDRTWHFFIRALYGRADCVVSPTAFGAEELRRHGLRVPIEVITNGIPPAFHPGPAAREKRHEGRFLILSVSRLAREKRLDVIVEAVRRSRHAAEIQLVLCGHGPEEARLRALASTLPRPAEIRVVDERDMPNLMRSADLLVHAADVELEGMAILEALGTGLPTLVAEAPMSAASTMTIGEAFRFPAGDVDALARRIDHLVEHPDELAAARPATLAAAEGRTLAASVEKLEAIYARVARRRPASPNLG